MAKILVAASPEPLEIVKRILAGHELSYAGAMAQAEQHLRDGIFDLIVCTIAFDESKMFDLLRLAKSRPEWQRILFVVARVRPYVLRSPTSLRTAAFTCGALGAEGFLDIDDYQGDQEAEMRKAIDRILDGKSQVNT